MERRAFITLLAAGSVAACARPVHARIDGLTMGTRYAVELADPVDEETRKGIAALIDRELAGVNRAMSTYDARSELSAFNASRELGWMPASQGLLEVLYRASRVSAATQGAFDVTVGPLVELWGFGPQYRPRQVPDGGLIEQVRQGVGYAHLQLDPSTGRMRKQDARTRVDLGAIAKGYGVDRVAMLLDGQGMRNYLVEIGGEFRARGTTAAGRSWRVGIERPVAGRRVLGETISLGNRAIATSGTTRDYFQQDGHLYSHCIDPATAQPVSHPPIAVSVVADTATEADAWATALLVLGPERGYALAQARSIAALLVTANGSTFDVRVTDALHGHLVA